MKNWILRYWLLILGLLPLPLLALRASQGGAFEIINPAGTLSTLAFAGCLSCTPPHLLICQAWLLKLKRPSVPDTFAFSPLVRCLSRTAFIFG